MKKLLSVGLIAAFVIFLSSCEEAPEAKFSYTIDASDAKMVTFVNETVGATSYIWQFGDGSTSEEESPVHTYNAGGDYLVALVAQNDQGISEPLIKTIVIDNDGHIEAVITDKPEKKPAAPMGGDGGGMDF